MTKRTYGMRLDGTPIVAPPGWRILPEGEEVPHVHREFTFRPPYGAASKASEAWCAPRRTISTMTAIYACIWGHVIAYAVPVTE